MKGEMLRRVIGLAKKGKQAAFTQLYDSTRNDAYFVARRYLSDADAADALQEAYITAFDKLSEFDESKDFAPWLHTIVRHKCLDLLKKQQRFASINEEQLGEAVQDEYLVPAEALENKEKRRDILRLIDKLSVGQRTVVDLFYLEGMKIAEISEEMGVSEGTVKSQLYQARKAIKGAALMEEKKGNKLYGAAGTSVLTQLFQKEMKSGYYKMPSALSKTVLTNVMQGVATTAVTTGVTAGGATLLLAKLAGAKALACAACAVVVVGGVAVPMYVHTENVKAAEAMAIVEEQQETAQIEAERVAAERLVAEQKAAERLIADQEAAEQEAADKLEADKLAAEQLAKEQEAVVPPVKAPVTAPADKGVQAPAAATPKATPKAGGGALHKDAKVGDVLEGGGEVIGHLETGDGSMYDGIPITKGSRGTIMSDEYAQDQLDKLNRYRASQAD